MVGLGDGWGGKGILLVVVVGGGVGGCSCVGEAGVGGGGVRVWEKRELVGGVRVWEKRELGGVSAYGRSGSWLVGCVRRKGREMLGRRGR